MSVRAWFPFYPADWLLDDDVMDMSLAEQGAYACLLMYQWHDGTCSLPNDPERLRKMLRCTNKEFTKIWPAVSKKFPPMPGDGSRLANLRLLSVRSEAEEKSDKARMSARKRWETQTPDDANALRPESDRNAHRSDHSRSDHTNISPHARAHEDEARSGHSRCDRAALEQAWVKHVRQLPGPGLLELLTTVEEHARLRGVRADELAEKCIAAFVAWVDGQPLKFRPGKTPAKLVEHFAKIAEIVDGKRPAVAPPLEEQSRSGTSSPRDEIRAQPPHVGARLAELRRKAGEP